MSEDTSISQTMRRPTGGNRTLGRLPLVQIIGAGASIDSLRNPRSVTFGDTLLIGRRSSPANESGDRISINDATVSGKHALITRVPSVQPAQSSQAAPINDEYLIEDLGSTNGTFVGGKRIIGQTRLPSGSLIFLGAHVLMFRTVTPTEMAALGEEQARPLAPVPTLSPVVAMMGTKIRLLARSTNEILLVGETGSGKEVFANAIHKTSGRQGKLVPVNCAAIPKELVESELFGYEKGAHSTAQGRKTGLVEAANGGTLFLDELGDMPLELQSKLLRFLQDKRFTPLGSTRVIEADVRVIAATSRTTLDKGGHLQEALLGRLGAQPIVLPPLRERVEDIGRLAAFFLQQAGDDRGFEPEALHALLLYGWPLNVRGLAKVIGEASLLSRGAPAIGLEHLPDSVTADFQLDAEELEGAADDLADSTHVDAAPAAYAEADSDRINAFDGAPKTARVSKRVRRPAPTAEELTALLGEFQGSVAQVARHLDRQYAVVWRCIQRYGIDANAYRPLALQQRNE